MRRLLAAVGMVGLAVPAWAGTPAPPAADVLVEQLGAATFAEREAAGRALLTLGADALPVLDRVAGSGADPEARERASRIAEQIRRADENGKHLAVPVVSFDYANTPLATAVTDLKTKTGIPLTLSPGAVKDQARPVTAKAGPLPPWQAVEAFCQAAGLREVLPADGNVTDGPPNANVYSGRRRTAYSFSETPPPLPGALPILLADGTGDPLPGERSAAVRVVALPPGFAGNRVIRGAGEVVLTLDVTSLPGLRWQEATGVRVTRAADDTGRAVLMSFRQDPPTVANPYYEQQLWIGGFAGNVIFDDYGMPRQQARPNPRLVPLRLRTDDRAIPKLTVLEGVVTGEVVLPNQTLIAVPDLPRSAGQTFHGPNDTRLTVAGYEVKPGAGLTVRVRVEGPNPWTLQRFGMQNRFAVMNAMPIAPGDGIGLTAGLGQMKFQDAAGKSVRPPTVTNSNMNDDGFRQSQEMELVFPKPGETGTPMRLVVVGNKGIAVEVPFRLKDVRLP